MKDVPIGHWREEYVADTVPKLRHAGMKDVRTLPKKEEFVSVMEERDIVPLKDAPIKYSTEEYAKNMEQNGRETVMKGEWYQ